jgi:hypothetical protein
MERVDFRETKITFPSPKAERKKRFQSRCQRCGCRYWKNEKLKENRTPWIFLFNDRAAGSSFSSRTSCLAFVFMACASPLSTGCGVREYRAKRLVNHALALAHKIYQREKVDGDVM